MRMISYEPELIALRNGGALDEATAQALIAEERREIFSIRPELRILTWLGVLAITTGLGVVLSKHIDQIGPAAIAVGLALVAAAGYGFAWWKRGRKVSLADDYVLLLASLIFSADVGYIEHTFHVLGSAWPRHLLLLAIVHAFVAYVFESRLVLSTSISALAAYLGIERNADSLFGARAATETAIRSFFLAAILFVWREVDRRTRAATPFSELFAHAATNLAFWGALLLTFSRDTAVIGGLLALVLAAISIGHGLNIHSEAFVMYGYVYGIVGFDALVVHFVDESALLFFYFVISTIAAIVGLFVTHARMRRRTA
jgi:hypothetical protein